MPLLMQPCQCRYDPDTAVVDDIDTPQERVTFLQDVAQAMLVKGRVKLNIKRLYAADGRAVRELLKVADLLYRASLQAEQDPGVRPRPSQPAVPCCDAGNLKPCACRRIWRGARTKQ